MNTPAIAQKALSDRNELLSAWKGDGLMWCQKNSGLADEAIAAVCNETYPETGIAIVAVGGYGRGEIGPQSDLDIVFLSSDDEKAAGELEIKTLFKEILALSETVGWDMDYALRFPSDIPALDDKSRTALLDARFLVGNRGLYDFFIRAFESTFPTAQFLSDKIREREQRSLIEGESPNIVEFNLREGPGGLRDYQASKWFEKVLVLESLKDNRDCYDLLWSVRNAIQLATGRKEDRLLRPRQAEIARLLDTDFQSLYSQLMECAHSICANWRTIERRAHYAEITLSRGMTAANGTAQAADGCTISELLSGICAAVDLRITVEQIPDAEYTIGDGPAAADCLARGSRYLYAFDRSRALEMLIPEWKPARHLLPDDSMHRFTVGEHTLQLVAELDRLKEDDSLFGAWDEVDRRSLYLAAIFHDLGKIDSSKPHSEAGAEMAQLFAQKMSLHSEESSSIVWLIREHLTLAKMARTHDLKMPAAPLELATLCQTRQRLSMLYLLTIADIQAVSPEAMTPHLAESLRQLYDSARSAIEVESVHLDPAQYRSAALEKLRGTVAQESVSQWLAMMPSHYLIGTARDKFPLHFELVERARQGELNVIFENVPKSALTEITICCKDLPQPGLLSRILGVLYAHDLTIHGVRAASTDEVEAIALDQIAVSYRGAILPSNLSAMVSDSIKRCILNEGALDEVLRSHNKNPEQRQRFLHYRFIDGSPAVVETETPLGRGMPYRVTKMLAAFGWNVYVARMGQWADRAVARFYLVDPSGPLSAEKVAAAIEGYR